MATKKTTRRRRRGTGTETTTTQERVSGNPEPEVQTSESVPVDGLPEHCARVRVGGSITRNMGDFNSVRVSVEVEMPCAPEDVQQCYDETAMRVDDMLNSELEAATRS